MSKRKSQDKRILDFIIEHGSITRYKAVFDLGIFELAARIRKLETDGHRFIKLPRSTVDRFGGTVYFKEYKLEAAK